MNTVSMSVSDWIKVRDNPIQRDTERHAAKAKHLLTPLSIHAITYAAELPNGELVKLDGHTRALLWKRNEVRHPSKVCVNVIPVASLQEAQDLYKTLDSKEALENSTDKIFGAFRLCRFVPESGLLKHGSITHALRIAHGAVIGYAGTGGALRAPVYDIVQLYIAELAALDDLGLGQGKFTSGLVAAFLISYRKHNDRVLPFWRAFIADGGTKTDGKMDGVQALKEYTLRMEGSFGGSAMYEIAARSLGAIEKWLADELLSSAPKALSVAEYLDRTAPARFNLIKKSKAA